MSQDKKPKGTGNLKLLLFVMLFMWSLLAEIYMIREYPKQYIVIGMIGVLMGILAALVVWDFTKTLNLIKQEQPKVPLEVRAQPEAVKVSSGMEAEQFEEWMRSQKAIYLLMKKSNQHIEKMLDLIGRNQIALANQQTKALQEIGEKLISNQQLSSEVLENSQSAANMVQGSENSAIIEKMAESNVALAESVKESIKELQESIIETNTEGFKKIERTNAAVTNEMRTTFDIDELANANRELIKELSTTLQSMLSGQMPLSSEISEEAIEESSVDELMEDEMVVEEAPIEEALVEEVIGEPEVAVEAEEIVAEEPETIEQEEVVIEEPEKVEEAEEIATEEPTAVEEAIITEPEVAATAEKEAEAATIEEPAMGMDPNRQLSPEEIAQLFAGI